MHTSKLKSHLLVVILALPGRSFRQTVFCFWDANSNVNCHRGRAF